MNRGEVRVYIACSLDGFIAGPNDDLSWLPGADPEASGDPPTDDAPATGGDDGAVGFEDFLGEVGALLMGRRTYDMVAGFGGAWPYGERPVLVATHRPLDPPRPEVRAVEGEIATLVAAAREAAGGKDVYLDGGHLARQALDAGLVDDLILTLVPVVLGAGHPLFAGVRQRHTLEFVAQHDFGGGMVQLHYRPTDRT
jgi:dihydrofolate reductase